MDNQVKEILEVKKSTVGVRVELPKGVHKAVVKLQETMPRSVTIPDVCVTLIKEAIEARKAASNPPVATLPE